MNQQIRSIIFGVAGLLVLAGAILFLTHWAVAPYLFAVGAAGIAVCYLTLPVKDLDFRRRRLHRFNVFAGLLMIVSSGFMFNNRTEWILCLSVAAILQVYTAFVTPKEWPQNAVSTDEYILTRPTQYILLCRYSISSIKSPVSTVKKGVSNVPLIHPFFYKFY